MTEVLLFMLLPYFGLPGASQGSQAGETCLVCVRWRLRGGRIKPVGNDSGTLHCISSAFRETCVCDGIMWRVCLHVCGSVSVCLSEREEKRMKSEQTAWWGIYVIHAQNVQCCKADSHPSPGSAVLQGLHRPDLNVKCRRRN